MDEGEFRGRLDAITTDRSADLWLTDLRRLRSEYPHTVELAEVELDRGFNCFAFALGLCTSQAYFNVASRSRSPNIHASSEFARWLLEHGRLERHVTPSTTESIAIYFMGSEPTHAGQLRLDRILSKWGTGYWFTHALFEVPASYGSRADFFVPPTETDIEHAFLEFAVLKGVPVERLVPR